MNPIVPQRPGRNRKNGKETETMISAVVILLCR